MHEQGHDGRLVELLRSQGPRLRVIEAFLRQELDAEGLGSCQLCRFGSRGYQIELPSSDMDMVVVLPQNTPIHGDHGVHAVMGKFVKRFRENPMCCNVIGSAHKWTISFEYSGIGVDSTTVVGTSGATGLLGSRGGSTTPLRRWGPMPVL